MNKEAIRRTAVCRWDSESECYVVESPLCDRVLGAAATEVEAWKIFDEILEDTYRDYREGKLAGYSKPGRPKKEKTRFHAEMKPDAKEAITDMARALGISQGETVEYLLSFFEAQKSKQGRRTGKSLI
jgi:hypothetical protein